MSVYMYACTAIVFIPLFDQHQRKIWDIPQMLYSMTENLKAHCPANYNLWYKHTCPSDNSTSLFSRACDTRNQSQLLVHDLSSEPIASLLLLQPPVGWQTSSNSTLGTFLRDLWILQPPLRFALYTTAFFHVFQCDRCLPCFHTCPGRLPCLLPPIPTIWPQNLNQVWW